MQNFAVFEDGSKSLAELNEKRARVEEDNGEFESRLA